MYIFGHGAAGSVKQNPTRQSCLPKEALPSFLKSNTIGLQHHKAERLTKIAWGLQKGMSYRSPYNETPFNVRSPESGYIRLFQTLQGKGAPKAREDDLKLIQEFLFDIQADSPINQKGAALLYSACGRILSCIGDPQKTVVDGVHKAGNTTDNRPLDLLKQDLQELRSIQELVRPLLPQQPVHSVAATPSLSVSNVMKLTAFGLMGLATGVASAASTAGTANAWFPFEDPEPTCSAEVLDRTYDFPYPTKELTRKSVYAERGYERKSQTPKLDWYPVEDEIDCIKQRLETARCTDVGFSSEEEFAFIDLLERLGLDSYRKYTQLPLFMFVNKLSELTPPKGSPLQTALEKILPILEKQRYCQTQNGFKNILIMTITRFKSGEKNGVQNLHGHVSGGNFILMSFSKHGGAGSLLIKDQKDAFIDGLAEDGNYVYKFKETALALGRSPLAMAPIGSACSVPSQYPHKSPAEENPNPYDRFFIFIITVPEGPKSS